ncbi:type III restriction enzyme [Hathewaya proteolytica DSM 3090]|uniref:Type III restriction enzyme n=1 Tax=Hathewaya proteolytica DSM 3090 TaxID=1121331 RepID=A0A1M6SDL8_9CLOT|nr:DEAD/DEAH box helicase family protein [Hathewaya proteolytica]SHK42588.1 type III restriction enzyme [Hathewaya proteolytica DSM 3090]
MELKNYQKKVMDNLSSYMNCLRRSENLISAWREYWFRQDINVGLGGVPFYKENIPGVPHVCMKVPTGGGKTFMACCAIKRIYDAMPLDKLKVVVWLVPSDAILRQTINTLSNTSHPYRQKLDMDFSGKVGVYTKEQLLNGQNFSPDTVREMLTICILSYGSLRIDSTKKDVRKVYQENGNFLRFADYFRDKDILLADTPDTALIQVLRQLSPVTVVDESHNARSDLSVEMLNNLNPSFVLDLTATPRDNSNILSYVDARELKKENMVKLPVVVFNRTSLQSVIQDAIQLRGSIEKQAQDEEYAGGEYIRPIVLFQAQPNIKGKDNETFDKIKQKLVDIGVPEEQIAIKTSDNDELKDIDLMSHNCKIRYIITVNALKEGWDCPFAYILASLTNKTSKVDVEQIVGRILRQPYTKKHSSALLNTSYVLTCSNDFHNTLESVVTGLNQAGFSRKDYRVGEAVPTGTDEQESASERPSGEQQNVTDYLSGQNDNQTGDSSNETGTEDFDNVSADYIKEQLQISSESVGTNESVNTMIQQVESQSNEYEQDAAESESSGFIGGELGNMLTQNEIQSQYKSDAEAVHIPQFFLETSPDLFGDAYDPLEPENLSKGFSLSGQDADISFELSTGEMYRVDLQEQGDAVPKYMRVSKRDSEYLREYLARLPQERKVKACIDNISGLINRNNRYAAREISDYVRRVVSNMTEDEMTAMETSLPVYAKKIQDKIEKLEDVYREKQFDKLIDSGKIICRENYTFPDVITPADTIDSIPNSLYVAEKNDMNNFERQLLDVIASQDNVLWWHRNIERKGFRINGYINHYPDFIVRTKTGKTVLIEAKGDYLDGYDSKTKLNLGRKWQSLAGRLYRYFMVFKDKDLGMDGAYTIDKFVEMFKDL